MNWRVLTIVTVVTMGGYLRAQPQPPVSPPETPEVVPLNQERILKVIPDYQTVEDSHRLVAPIDRKSVV